jgi:hypothetical protein
MQRATRLALCLVLGLALLFAILSPRLVHVLEVSHRDGCVRRRWVLSFGTWEILSCGERTQDTPVSRAIRNFGVTRPFAPEQEWCAAIRPSSGRVDAAGTRMLRDCESDEVAAFIAIVLRCDTAAQQVWLDRILDPNSVGPVVVTLASFGPLRGLSRLSCHEISFWWDETQDRLEHDYWQIVADAEYARRPLDLGEAQDGKHP